MATEEFELTIEIVCTDLPGLEWEGRGDLHLGLQDGDELKEAVPANVERVTFRPVLRVRKHTDGSANFLGPFAHGPRTGRFIYLIWALLEGQPPAGRMIGRVKVLLGHIGWGDVQRALARRRPIKVTLALTDKKGRPAFAAIPPDRAKWVL
jgi:hypothetical protein